MSAEMTSSIKYQIRAMLHLSSMVWKGMKTLLANSYDFVIKENYRKCKTTMSNFDSSRLMSLITVSVGMQEMPVMAEAKFSCLAQLI